jgi:hypothetical protein
LKDEGLIGKYLGVDIRQQDLSSFKQAYSAFLDQKNYKISWD